MLYTPMKKSDYTIMASGKLRGLGAAPCSDELWNLATITSRAPFSWELRNVHDMQLPAVFPNLNHAQMDLMKFIGDKPVRLMVLSMTPMEFYHTLNDTADQDLSHLHLVSYWQGVDVLRKVVRGRAYAWYKSQGSKLTAEQQLYIDMVVPGYGHKSKRGRKGCQQ